MSKIIFLKETFHAELIRSVKPVLFFAWALRVGESISQKCVCIFSPACGTPVPINSNLQPAKPSEETQPSVSAAPSRDGWLWTPAQRLPCVLGFKPARFPIWAMHGLDNESKERHGLNTFHLGRKKHFSFRRYGDLPCLSCPLAPCRGELKAVGCCRDRSYFFPYPHQDDVVCLLGKQVCIVNW